MAKAGTESRLQSDSQSFSFIEVLLFEDRLVFVSADNVKMNSPFRWPGGKFYARNLILPLLPVHGSYCEPFAGGASIFFSKEKTEKNVLNDIDFDVANTLTQIRDSVEELIGLLDGIPAEKHLHGFYKNEYEPDSDIEKAFRWFYLNRTSYCGIVKHNNCYWGYDAKYSMPPENWPRHLRKVSSKLSGVKILSEDFEVLLDSLDDGFFLFVDPPYYASDQNKFYTHPFSEGDHLRLSQCLYRNRDRFRFIVTYDNVSEIKDMYKWCSFMEDKEWHYAIDRTDYRQTEDGKGKRVRGKEIFIANYIP